MGIIKEENFLVKFVKVTWIIVLTSTIYQHFFYATWDNIFAVYCIILIWICFTNFFLQPEILFWYPLSVFLIFGFTSTQFFFPLVFTSLEGKPVSYNLIIPLQVFFHSSLAFFILLISHMVYREITKSKKYIERNSSILVRAGLFDPPSLIQIWIMGLIGLLTAFYVHLYTGTASVQTGAASDKFLQSLVVFSYAPYLIYFRSLYGNKIYISKMNIPLLIIYTAFLFTLSIAQNSRAAFMIGFTSVGFSYFLALIFGFFDSRILTFRNAIITITLFWLMTGPLVNIGTAMVIVREHRSEIPYNELLSLTIETYKNLNDLTLYADMTNSEKQEWDEDYLKNIFIARFSNLKFNDNSLLLSSQVNEYDSFMLDFTIDRTLSSMPSPMLDFIKLDVDKMTTLTFSYGDLLFSKSSGNTHVLGSFLTGHFAGTGMAAFGWWYLVILSIIIIPIYYFFDKLTIQLTDRSQITKETSISKIRFSFCSLLILTTIFQFLSVESIGEILAFLIRGCFQIVLLYTIIFKLSQLISSVLFNSIPTELRK